MVKTFALVALLAVIAVAERDSETVDERAGSDFAPRDFHKAYC